MRKDIFRQRLYAARLFAINVYMNDVSPQPFSCLQVVCLILQNENGETLSARRPPHKHLGGRWEFPGGKIEPGETPEAALRREILEELSLELGDLQSLSPIEHTYDYGLVRLIPFRASAQAPVIHLTEHTEFRWLAPAELDNVAWMPADLPILMQLR